MRILILLLLITTSYASIHRIDRDHNLLVDTGKPVLNQYSYINYDVIGKGNITVRELGSDISFTKREAEIKRTNGRLKLEFTTNETVILRINKGKKNTPSSDTTITTFVIFGIALGLLIFPIGYSVCIVVLFLMLLPPYLLVRFQRIIRKTKHPLWNRMSERGECPICLDDKELCKLECGHELCSLCLEQIKAGSSTCPLCRQLIEN